MILKTLALALVAGAALCLAGCGSLATTAPALVNSLAAAGCSGTLDITATATTAAMGVPSANLSNTFHGACTPPPAKAAPTAAAQ